MRKRYVALEFQRDGTWYEMSVTVEQLWQLVRDPRVTHLETIG